jgi:hypothetical protein
MRLVRSSLTKLREFCFVRLRKAPRRVADNLNALDSSQLRCKQLLTPDTARRCESIVPQT